jgi:hypothetical protein
MGGGAESESLALYKSFNTLWDGHSAGFLVDLWHPYNRALSVWIHKKIKKLIIKILDESRCGRCFPGLRHCRARQPSAGKSDSFLQVYALKVHKNENFFDWEIIGGGTIGGL